LFVTAANCIQVSKSKSLFSSVPYCIVWLMGNYFKRRR